jgi:mono/diheme cytochrome c family protein
MFAMKWRWFSCVGIMSMVAGFGLIWPQRAAADDELPDVIEFNRDVRPILSNHCFTCHGPDNNNRKAKLRLDVEQSAHEDRGGYKAVDPGKTATSELVLRITSKDLKERMPPAKVSKALTTREIALLERWIEQGGKYQAHWSLLAAKRPAVPKLKAGFGAAGV